ncbi:MAG TPA: hypothetical protein VMY87_02830 [Armatimonadota bacterium]|nr:hypothetical protein [Armatimonadota bacterium]
MPSRTREARLRPPRALRWAKLLPRRQPLGAAEGAGALLSTWRNRLLRRAVGDRAVAGGAVGVGAALLL